MSEKLMVPAAPEAVPRVPRSIRQVFLGGAVGLVAGLAIAFAFAMFDGYAKGMTPLACLAYGCTLTMLLSHPAGIGGMLIGATLGALRGGCFGRRSTPPA